MVDYPVHSALRRMLNQNDTAQFRIHEKSLYDSECERTPVKVVCYREYAVIDFAGTLGEGAL